jgi:hypothetical protein
LLLLTITVYFFLARLLLLPTTTTPGSSGPQQAFYNEGYVCGETGASLYFEGFSTSTFERDGTLTSTPFLSDGLDIPTEIDDSDYKLIPVDENTLYGSATNGIYFVTETFVFTNADKSEANAVQDVFMFFNEQYVLVQSTRTVFNRLPDAETFVQMIQDDYIKYNITESGRFDAPMLTDCLGFPGCPTEELWCGIDPNCSVSPFQEPDSDVNPGVIAGFLIAGFALIFAAAYVWHRHRMATQAQSYCSQFSRRIAETITLTSGTRQVTKEALLEEFDCIDSQHKDGFISKGELWEFVSSGKAGDMDEHDFNALFNAIDLDKNGLVDFLEFCAFMGKCDDELEVMKRRESVMASRPSMKVMAAARLSVRSSAAMRLSLTAIPPKIMEDGAPDEEERDEAV